MKVYFKIPWTFSSAKPENVSNEGKLEGKWGTEKSGQGFAQVLLDFYSFLTNLEENVFYEIVKLRRKDKRHHIFVIIETAIINILTHLCLLMYLCTYWKGKKIVLFYILNITWLLGKQLNNLWTLPRINNVIICVYIFFTESEKIRKSWKSKEKANSNVEKWWVGCR